MNAGKGKGILAVMMAVVLASCSASVPQPTMEELLAEVNAEHQAIGKAQIQEEFLRKQSERIEFDPYKNIFQVSEEEFDPQQELTVEQLREDVDYLFNVFHDTYALYDYFGGDEVFHAAKEAVIEECESSASLTGEILEQSLLKNLTFIKDGHFSINGQSTQQRAYPFFYREVAFVKTDEGYQTVDGKRVESVDGYDDLDALMKRSISPEGELVYYPVRLEKRPSAEEEQGYSEAAALTVHYQGGEEQTLTAEPFQMYYQDQEENLLIEYNGEIPVVRLRNFVDEGQRKMRTFMRELEKHQPVIVDLRSNKGGYPRDLESFIIYFAGENIPGNYLTMDTWDASLYTTQEDVFWPNDRLIIVLTGKKSASSAELFVDTMHNLENVLIIGENTSGTILSSSERKQLPNSKIIATMGRTTIHLFPGEDYFEELRGFYPDIWVPAAEAEELAVKLIEQLQ